MTNNKLMIDYTKRKNTELFNKMKDPQILDISCIQNYIPIYNNFFKLNNTNYNSVNFNNNWYIHNIDNCSSSENIFNCYLKNLKNKKEMKKDVFFKLAPLLDPFKYLMGKYDLTNNNLFNLPKLDNNNVEEKIQSYNNTAYIDSFFSYLSSMLILKYNFTPSINFYGSFLGIKNNYKVNVYDDIEYLHKSDFFIDHKHKEFEIDEYEYLITDCDIDIIKTLPKINIDTNNLENDKLVTDELDEDIFHNIFEKDNSDNDESKDNETNYITLNELDNSLDLVDLSINDFPCVNNINSLKSNSTCSSRVSYSSDDSEDEHENEDENDSNMTSDKSDDNSLSSWSGYSSTNESEEIINATLKKFPIQIICLEKCENTFDKLIMDDELSQDEWFSALMQIIMILLTYQNSFSFTHNDLHTNNVMYNSTNKKFLYYCYNNTYYKVPTFGKIFKIIDFGRAIYTYSGIVYCSDSFKPGEDASTQYNTEPYFNPNKPRLDPNYSFDLCRLACSIYDYVIDERTNDKTIQKQSAIAQLIYDWCKDDNNINILYKSNGEERYPEFKLYKMIARCVHRHTPNNQLQRKHFKKYIVHKSEIPSNIIDNHLINIDNIPNFS